MLDRYGRIIDYLRISVTDRCNLRCRYCMPEEGVSLLAPEAILSFEEIADVAHTAIGLGITHVRLTGGEPLVRRHIATLVGMIAAMEGLRDFSMTTNGVLLEEHAGSLAAAGLHRVNVSLDAIDPQRYAAITRGGDVRRVLAGIEAAQAAGLSPVKINCVVSESWQQRDSQEVADFAAARGLKVRFIREMNLSTGQFAHVEGGSGGQCSRCNRLRLTSDGQIRPCLFSNLGYSVRQLGPRNAMLQAIARKPESGSVCTNHAIHSIGG